MIRAIERDGAARGDDPNHGSAWPVFRARKRVCLIVQTACATRSLARTVQAAHAKLRIAAMIVWRYCGQRDPRRLT
jgi:hypothetical protein